MKSASEAGGGRYLLYGFQDAIFNALCEAGIPPAAWVRLGGGRFTGDVHGAVMHQQAKLNRFELDEIPITDMSTDLQRRVWERSYHLFLRNTFRRNRCFFQRRNVKYYENVFDMMVNWYHHLLVSNSIEMVIFGSVPHKGADMALYHLAREMGLETAITFQAPTFLPVDTFTIISHLEDLGYYQTAMPVLAEERLEPDLVPVRRRPEYAEEKARHRLRLVLDLMVRNFFKAMASLVWDFGKRRKTQVRFSHFCGSLSRLTFLFHRPRLARSFNPSELEGRCFIYVPLHLEPEVVVDVLGANYSPQLRLVERLARIVPDDVLIVVKENPNQSFFGREKPFYRRLEALENVVYIKEDADTFWLIEHALAVGVVLGTAGWEALKFGKPVVCAGLAWYRGLPGVFKVDDVTFSDLESFQFDQKKFKKAAFKLAGFYRKGLPVDTESFVEYVSNFNERDNALNVAAALRAYLTSGHRQQTAE